MSDPPPPAAARPLWLGKGDAPDTPVNTDKIAAITAPNTLYPEFWPGSGAAILSTALCKRPARKFSGQTLPPVILRAGVNKKKSIVEASYVWLNKYTWQLLCVFPISIHVGWTIEDLWDEVDIHIEGKDFCNEMLKFFKYAAQAEALEVSNRLMCYQPQRMLDLFNEMRSLGQVPDPQHDLAVVDKIFTIDERNNFPRIYLWHVANITYLGLQSVDNMKILTSLANMRQLSTLTEHQETTTVAPNTLVAESNGKVSQMAQAMPPRDTKAPVLVKAQGVAQAETDFTDLLKSEAIISLVKTKTLESNGIEATTPTEAVVIPSVETGVDASTAMNPNTPKATKASVPKEVQPTVTLDSGTLDAAKALVSMTDVVVEPTRSKTNRKIKRSRSAKLMPSTEPLDSAGTPAAEATATTSASDHTLMPATAPPHHRQPMASNESMSKGVSSTAQPLSVGHGTNLHGRMAPNHHSRKKEFNTLNQPRGPPMQVENVNRNPSGPYSYQPPGPASNIQPPHFAGHNGSMAPGWMVDPNQPPHTYGPGTVMIPPPANMPPQHFEPSQHGATLPGQLSPISNQAMPYMHSQLQTFYGWHGHPLTYTGCYLVPPNYQDPRTGIPHHAANFNSNGGFNSGNNLFDPNSGTGRKVNERTAYNGRHRFPEDSVTGPAERPRKFSNTPLSKTRSHPTDGWRPSEYFEIDQAITRDHRFGCQDTWIGPENETVMELFIGDLPDRVDENELGALFEQKVGVLPIRIEIKSPRHDGGFRNTRLHAFVGFSSTADTKKALRIRDQKPALRGQFLKVMVPRAYYTKSSDASRRFSVTSGTKGTAMNGDKQKGPYSPQDARSDLQKKDTWKEKEAIDTPASSGSPEVHRPGRRHASPAKRKEGSPTKRKPAKKDAKPAQPLTAESSELMRSETTSKAVKSDGPSNSPNGDEFSKPVKSDEPSKLLKNEEVPPTKKKAAKNGAKAAQLSTNEPSDLVKSEKPSKPVDSNESSKAVKSNNPSKPKKGDEPPEPVNNEECSPKKKKAAKNFDAKPAQTSIGGPSEPTESDEPSNLAKGDESTTNVIVKLPKSSEDPFGVTIVATDETLSHSGDSKMVAAPTHLDDSEMVEPTHSDNTVTIAITPAADEFVSDEEAKKDHSFHSTKESLNDNLSVPEKTGNENRPEQEVATFSREPILRSPTEPQVSLVEKVGSEKPIAKAETEPIIPPQTEHRLHNVEKVETTQPANESTTEPDVQVQPRSHSHAKDAEIIKSASDVSIQSIIEAQTQPAHNSVENVEPSKSVLKMTTMTRPEDAKSATTQNDAPTAVSSATVENITTGSAPAMKPATSLVTPGASQTGSLSPFAKPSKAQQKKEKEARKKQQRKEAEKEKEKAKAKIAASKSAADSTTKASREQPIKNKKSPPPALPILKLHSQKEASQVAASDTASVASTTTLHADDGALMSPSPPRDGYYAALQTPLPPVARLDDPEAKASPDAKTSLEATASPEGEASSEKAFLGTKVSPEVKASPEVKTSSETKTLPEAQPSHSDVLQEQVLKRKKKNKKKSKNTGNQTAGDQTTENQINSTDTVRTEIPMDAHTYDIARRRFEMEFDTTRRTF